jgi:hypothetical protein
VLSRYFHGEAFERKAITKHEHYSQRVRSPNCSATGRGRLASCRNWHSRLNRSCGATMPPGSCRRTDRLAQRAQNHPARPHHPYKSWSVKPCPPNAALGRLAGRSVGRIGQSCAGPAPGA